MQNKESFCGNNFTASGNKENLILYFGVSHNGRVYGIKHHTWSNKTKVIHEIEVYEHNSDDSKHASRNDFVYMLIKFPRHVLEKILYFKRRTTTIVTKIANKVSQFNYDDSFNGAKNLRIYIHSCITSISSSHITIYCLLKLIMLR